MVTRENNLPFDGLICQEQSFNELFNIDGVSNQLKIGYIFICQEGEAEFMLDMKTFIIKKGDLCVLFPYSLQRTIKKSDDFHGYTMAFSIETVKMIELPSKPSHYLFIKEHPCISLSDDENTSLFELFDLAKKKSTRGNYLFQKEIEEKISMLISYEIAAIYAKGKPIEEKERPRQDLIFRNFLFSLAKNYKDKKDVNFYAQEQCITPRYLSYIVKEISGRGSAQWIISYVIREAKMLLTSSQLTIQQVSDELGFANPSFFSQYFKKYTGSTPKEFRKKGNTQ